MYIYSVGWMDERACARGYIRMEYSIIGWRCVHVSVVNVVVAAVALLEDTCLMT